MKMITNQAVFIFFTALFIGLLYCLSSILTPFLLGALFAYLANPLVKHLEKWRVPHLLSVILVFVFLFFVFVLILLMLFPIIQKQLVALIEVIPQILSWIQETIIPRFKEFVDLNTLKDNLSASVAKTGTVLTTVLHSGVTVIEWAVNIVLTPIVTFYLLRDWDKILQSARNLLPRSIKPTVVKLTQESNEVLSAFFRGQLLVMLALGLIYGIGLTLIGLKVGLMIGLLGGLLSIVPYLGSIFVVVMASITSGIEFGTWQSLLWVLLVFMIGQTIESYILTPYLVGERIGLHPVAVIFSVMAGGALFGFFGVLVALPTAAVIMVLLRFLRKQYQ